MGRVQDVPPSPRSHAHPSLVFYCVPCTDLEPMRQFYRDVLGLEEIAHRHGPEGGWAGFQAGRVQLVVVSGAYTDPPRGGPAVERAEGAGVTTTVGSSLRLELPEVRATALLDRLGARVESPSAPLGRGSSEARRYTLRDPMGNAVDVYASAPLRRDGRRTSG